MWGDERVQRCAWAGRARWPVALELGLQDSRADPWGLIMPVLYSYRVRASLPKLAGLRGSHSACTLQRKTILQKLCREIERMACNCSSWGNAVCKGRNVVSGPCIHRAESAATFQCDNVEEGMLYKRARS